MNRKFGLLALVAGIIVGRWWAHSPSTGAGSAMTQAVQGCHPVTLTIPQDSRPIIVETEDGFYCENDPSKTVVCTWDKFGVVHLKSRSGGDADFNPYFTVVKNGESAKCYDDRYGECLIFTSSATTYEISVGSYK
jgi:hypothetical protein